MIVVMVRIPVGSEEEGERLENRFRNRPGLVDSEPGFLGFELLKGEDEYISTTRWATRQDLDRWTRSQAHIQMHGGAQGQPPSGAHPQSGPLSQPQASSTRIYEVAIPGPGQS